jgi:mycothiol system anti-sigma-R factor
VTGGMDCTETHLRVYEYLDGELTVWKRLAITRHLDECPPCGEAFTFEVDLRRVVVSKCAEDVPAELKERIARALGIVDGPKSTSE